MQKIIFIILLLSQTVLFAQNDTLSQYYDKSEVEVRKISDSDLQEYRDNKDFDYRKEVTEPENYFAKIMNKIIDFFFGNGSSLGEILKYIIVALFFAFVISRLLGFKVYKLFYKNKSLDDIIPIEENIDDIKSDDIDNIIKQAIANEDYKRAIRYLFIKTLKQLSAKEIIEWQINKTNRDYYYEISDKQIKEQFVKLSQIFSYVWYGDFSIDKEKFNEFEQDFNHLFN